MGNTRSYLPSYREWFHQDKSTQTERETQTNSHGKSTQTMRETQTNSHSKSTQTNMKTRTNSVQTAVTFSDRLTHNQVNTVESSEMFENTCETCDKKLENQAVGICKTCRQYMCLQCCNIHGRISQTRCHKTVTKEEFKDEIIPTSLYNQKLAPISFDRIFSDFENQEFKIGIFNAPGSKDTLFWSLRKVQYQWNITVYNETMVNVSHIDQQSGRKSQICSGYHKKDYQKTYEAAKALPESKKLVYFAPVERFPIWNADFPNHTLTTVYKYCHSEKAIEEAFQHNGVCTSMAPFNSGLALAVYFQTKFSCPDWFIRCVDYKGNQTKQICYDQDGNQLFGEPRYLATNQAEDTLFISDYKQNCVLALDIYGQILYKFQHESISKPLGITSDEEQNVYVACGKAVVQIHRDGKQCTTILTSKEEADIVNVCYNPVSRQIAVADDNLKVTIFEFLQMA